jgi:hypothetical protein
MNTNKSDEIKSLPTDKDVITLQTREIVGEYFSPVQDTFSNFIQPIGIGVCTFLLINKTTTMKLEQFFEKNTIYIQTLLIIFLAFLFIKFL